MYIFNNLFHVHNFPSNNFEKATPALKQRRGSKAHKFKVLSRQLHAPAAELGEALDCCFSKPLPGILNLHVVRSINLKNKRFSRCSAS